MIKGILGTDVYQEFATQMIVAIFGVITSLLIDACYRNPDSPSTPQKFNPTFLIKDNWKRVSLALLLLWAFIRFFPDIFGFQIGLVWCWALGLSVDSLAGRAKQFSSILQVKRPGDQTKSFFTGNKGEIPK